jgi:hypothetical protein
MRVPPRHYSFDVLSRHSQLAGWPALPRPLLLRCGIFKLAIRRMAMHCDFMNWGNEIVTLEAVPARVGDGWRILIELVSGRIQYVSWFDTLRDAEDWIENNARSWVSSARNRL